MNFDYIDIHSHLYFPDFDKDKEDEIDKLKKEKIGTITIGTDVESSEKAIELAGKHENLFASVGWHPGDLTLESDSKSIFPELHKLAKMKKVVAIGECGLDYYRMDASNEKLKSIQRDIFQSHIDLALKFDKPLMLHIRPQKKTMDAYEDALVILEAQAKQSGEKLRGNVHFFVGDTEILKRFLDIGFTVSFTGVITFAYEYDESVKYAPLNMIMAETDAPFVAPEPYRGRRNSPLYVKEVVKRIAAIREEPEDEVKEAIKANAERIFLKNND